MKKLQRTLASITVATTIFFMALTNPAAKTAIENIPNYPGSQILCDQHITGNTMHVLWKSFSTRDAPSTVVTFFELKLGVKASVGKHDSKKIVHPSNEDLIVTIYQKQAAENFPNCLQKPAQTAETLILISEGIRSQN